MCLFGVLFVLFPEVQVTCCCSHDNSQSVHKFKTAYSLLSRGKLLCSDIENLKLDNTSGIIPCYDCLLQNIGMQSPIEAVTKWLLLQHLVSVKLIVGCGSKGTVAIASGGE